MNSNVPVWCVAALLLAWPGGPDAQQRRSGNLHVVVLDPSGAVIPGAVVHVRGAEESTRAVARTDLPSDGRGVAVAADLVPGRYTIEASYPGFETKVTPDVRFAPATTGVR